MGFCQPPGSVLTDPPTVTLTVCMTHQGIAGPCIGLITADCRLTPSKTDAVNVEFPSIHPVESCACQLCAEDSNKVPGGLTALG
mmetsp:Transcript_45008/g.73342  ORF Transcript_45008/g.73342 Transcript_45008/m.73342 type:complete len:84 (+) Transcript_45008:273-524(+)